jgi:branched-chain amino acid transport system ATP-binding protein
MGVEAVGIIGRNGMGKTTLCDTIMGLVRRTSGEVLLRGERIDGRSPEKVARSGISYVPQGRRLFASLTVDEHLRMLAKGTRGKRWTPEAVYELFPGWPSGAAAAAADLSGGSSRCCRRPGAAAQRLAGADGRAVRGTGAHDRRRPRRGGPPTGRRGHRVLVVEQKLLAATAMAERQLVMVSGRIQAETTATALREDPGAATPLPRRRQRRRDRGAPDTGTVDRRQRMTGTVNVALIGSKFMGRAHSNAWLKVAKFFPVDRCR